MLLAIFSLLALASTADAQLPLSLTPSVNSGAPVGTLVTWTASAPNPNSHPYRYRFLIHSKDQAPRILKDFGPENTLNWLPSVEEGLYTIEASARDIETGDTASTVATFNVVPALNSGAPAVALTVHPLVSLYSAPACPTGATMTVYYLAPGSPLQNAPARSCDGAHSMNFLLGGLRQSTFYYVKHIVQNGDAYSEGSVLSFTSGAAPTDLPVHTKLLGGDTTGNTQPVLLASSLFSRFVATDLDGNLIWYYPELGYTLTRPETGGRFLSFYQDPTGDQSVQTLREFDLAGVVISETNAERVNEQLVAMGRQPINAFHHEARRLKNGNLVVLGGVESVYTNVQQQTGSVDILGDMIIELDDNLNVVWTWDAFEHLDVSRLATLNDQCVPIACPPTFLSPTATDWTHGNSLAETPDGNLTYSTRSQDWVIKIDFQGGQGTGTVLWRLGNSGDFTLVGGDQNSWFSHQHDPHYLPDGSFIVLDNSNLRQASDASAHSRGQVWHLEEASRVATLVSSFDLGDYSYALGSAQKLDNGNYFFDDGFLLGSSATSTEFDPSGTAVYSIKSSTPEYRTFRMKDLYTP